MERYIQAGGGFVGIHAATDTEYEWAWNNKLVGAYFKSHPKVQDATLNIIDKNHLSTEFLGDTWVKADEWYNLKSINPNLNVLIKIDEKTYEGGENGDNHPISWYHEYDGGRAFYTVMGHTNETFNDPVFQKHLLGGINYAIGKNKLNYK
jgi:cytochrome c